MKEFVEKLIGRLEECTQVVHYGEIFIFLEEAEEIINQLAEEYKQCIKSSCSNCETYDKEKHCCPKWCDVIKGTVAEMDKNRWIPCSGCSDCKHKECENYGKV